MLGLDRVEILYVATAFLFQAILIVHFALRRWRFDVAMRYGPVVYALSIPAAVVSVVLFLGDKGWSLWIAGFIYPAWAIFGYTVEYIREIKWRTPPRWEILGPYLVLYLATVMFYWWPLADLYRPLWYAYAVLFIVSTALNVTSHGGRARHRFSG